MKNTSRRTSDVFVRRCEPFTVRRLIRIEREMVVPTDSQNEHTGFVLKTLSHRLIGVILQQCTVLPNVFFFEIQNFFEITRFFNLLTVSEPLSRPTRSRKINRQIPRRDRRTMRRSIKNTPIDIIITTTGKKQSSHGQPGWRVK